MTSRLKVAMSLSRFLSPTFASIEIASPQGKLARESDIRWTSAGRSITVFAEEGDDIYLSAGRVILEAAGDLQSVFLNFPLGDDNSPSLPPGSEITLIPTVNVATAEVRPFDHTIFVPDNGLGSLVKYEPVKFTLVYQKDPFKRVWIKS